MNGASRVGVLIQRVNLFLNFCIASKVGVALAGQFARAVRHPTTATTDLRPSSLISSLGGVLSTRKKKWGAKNADETPKRRPSFETEEPSIPVNSIAIAFRITKVLVHHHAKCN